MSVQHAIDFSGAQDGHGFAQMNQTARLVLKLQLFPVARTVFLQCLEERVPNPNYCNTNKSNIIVTFYIVQKA